MHTVTIGEKRSYKFKRALKGLWEDLDGRKGREKCYN